MCGAARSCPGGFVASQVGRPRVSSAAMRRLAIRTFLGILMVVFVVASVSWSVVLIGSGGSHGASLRLAGGVRVVLHHHGELPHGEPHEHEHGQNHGHHHDEHVPSDHVVAVSTDPASLRSHDANGLPDGAWSPVAVPSVVSYVPALRARGAVPGARGPTPLPLRRSTIVLLI